MNKKNVYWIIAGILNFLTALVHTIGGQMDLVNPLLKSDLTDQAKTEWVSVWHVITIVLFLTSFLLLKAGFNKEKAVTEVIKLIGVLYILFAIPFIVSCLVMTIFAPQWILLIPIGILALMGLKKI